MPSFPISLMIEKQLKPIIEGKIITEIRYEMCHRGKYSWHGDVIQNIDKIKNTKIVYADSKFILTDNNYLITFSYNPGDLRYFDKTSDIEAVPVKKSVSDGYTSVFCFNDGSCLRLVLRGWGTEFYIAENDAGDREKIILDRNHRITDDAAFTLEFFKTWLSDVDRVKMNIIENCSTCKGAFDIFNPVMSYILLISHIHPRTKTGRLSENEITELFYNIKSLVNEYKSGERICQFKDIFGKKAEEKNDILWLDSKALGTPCPICTTPIESTPCAGTRMYFCPNCQKIKK